MKKFKGTKGSFDLKEVYEDRISSADCVIDIWYGECSTITIEKARANAKLIAAAPLLLEALQNIENDNGSIPATTWKLRNEAINKALD